MNHAPQITAGPWKAKQVGTYNEPGWVVLYPDTTKPGVHMRRLDYRGCFTEADAQALSAAPEMLAALKALEFKLRGWPMPGLIAEYEAAVAAIAKAEGV